MKEIEIPEGCEAKIVDNKVVFVPKESEDERIRREMIEYFHGCIQRNKKSGFRVEQIKGWIAWLEKQKEQKSIEDVVKDITKNKEAATKFLKSAGIMNEDGELTEMYRSEQEPAIIQWTGNNLKEVIDFTGKSPKFDEWFKSWEDFENYVHSHGDILKLFCEDGSHYEVPVGAWIVKTPDGYNVPSVARFVSSSMERQQRNTNGYLSWKKFEDDGSGVPALLVSKALIRREGKYSVGFDVIGGDEYILIRDIEAAIVQKPAEWSEEDERRIVELKTFIAKCNGFNKENRKKAFDMIDALRPQPRRKDTYYDIIRNILATLKNMDL